MSDEKNSQVILDAGASLAKIQQLTTTGTSAPAVVVPNGYKLQVVTLDSIEPWLGKPTRKKGTFLFATVDSFIRYFNEHKNADSRIFAQVGDDSGSFRGTLNFHGTDPSFNDHHCAVELQPTKEWVTWTGHSKESMAQADFAEFLEENADMFTEPTGAALLELVSTLEGKSHVNVTSALKLQNRSVKLSYVEDVELKGGGNGSQSGDMIIPAFLNVGIAPFEGVSRYSMRARLRYKIDQRKISFWYETVDSHLVVRQVCTELMAAIEKQTGVQPFRV